jgi:hypothetical protein
VFGAVLHEAAPRSWPTCIQSRLRRPVRRFQRNAPVVTLARRATVDPRRLLGLAIAHEIGHLLLNSNHHAPTGVMRADWSQFSLRHGSADDWRFLPTEEAAMRAAIAARRSPANE